MGLCLERMVGFVFDGLGWSDVEGTGGIFSGPPTIFQALYSPADHGFYF